MKLFFATLILLVGFLQAQTSVWKFDSSDPLRADWNSVDRTFTVDQTTVSPADTVFIESRIWNVQSINENGTAVPFNGLLTTILEVDSLDTVDDRLWILPVYHYGDMLSFVGDTLDWISLTDTTVTRTELTHADEGSIFYFKTSPASSLKVPDAIGYSGISFRLYYHRPCKFAIKQVALTY